MDRTGTVYDGGARAAHALAVELADELDLARVDEASDRGRLEELERAVSVLRAALARLEVGFDPAKSVEETLAASSVLAREATTIRALRGAAPRRLRRRLAALASESEELASRLATPLRSEERVGTSARRRASLDRARVVSQDVHGALDYLSAGAMLVSALVARTSRARAVSLALAGVKTSATVVTDHRYALVRKVPVEVHRVHDHVWGTLALAAPTVLGYAKSDPLAATIQRVTGVLMHVASALTRYRAFRASSSEGGVQFGAEDSDRLRVPEVQRPLEGLSSAPTDWSPEPEREGSSAEEGWVGPEPALS